MKKKLAPFISGIGAGLCLSVVIMAVWGLVLPDHANVQAGGLNQGTAEMTAENDASGVTDTQPEQQEPAQGQSSGGSGRDSVPKQEGYKVVQIAPGMSATQIAELLETEGVIDSAQEFHDRVVQEKKTQKFIAGKFTLRCGAPYEELISILTSQPNSQ